MKPSRYGPFPYSPIVRRPCLTWPDGAHVALWVIPNIEFFSLMEKVPAGSGGPGTPTPDIPTWSARDYGNRVGVFRLMQVLDRHGVRGTVALNSDLCVHHPEIIEEGRKLSWEWMGHCEQHAPAERSRPGRRKGHHTAHAGNHRAGHRRAAGRLARVRPAGDLGHPRSACSRRMRIRLRLDQRRPALRHDPRRRRAAHFNSVQPRDQ